MHFDVSFVDATVLESVLRALAVGVRPTMEMYEAFLALDIVVVVALSPEAGMVALEVAAIHIVVHIDHMVKHIPWPTFVQTLLQKMVDIEVANHMDRALLSPRFLHTIQSCC